MRFWRRRHAPHYVITVQSVDPRQSKQLVLDALEDMKRRKGITP